MLKFFKKFIHQYLLKKGRAIVPATNHQKLKEFFSMVRPVSTSKPLVHIGCQGDGGYLVPEDFEGISACFSPGVSTVADFELDLAKKHIPCFLADYSVQSAPVQHPLIQFDKKFLGLTNDDIYTTLDRWVEEKMPKSEDFILQMDIEGSEYDVLFDVSEATLKKFRIIVIEFHHLDRLMVQDSFEFINLIFKKITKYFDVVHNHPNNCEKPYIYGEFEIPPIMEITFLRKGRGQYENKQLLFPHPLDRPNIPDRDDFPLPKCWYLN